MKIIICGKGGCGKSTVSALLSMALNKRGRKVLLVDADESNIGLYRMLGLEMPAPLMEHLGGKKGFSEKTKAAGVLIGGPPPLFPGELSTDALPAKCIASSNGLRVMSVGKIHHFGEGCACPMGKLFRMLFTALKLEMEELVIVDTAAGVEHFGRNLDGQCDRIICIIDPSYESLMMAKRVQSFAGEAGLPVSAILNKLTPEVEKELIPALGEIEIIGRLPNSHTVFLRTLKGEALNFELPEIEAVCDTITAW